LPPEVKAKTHQIQFQLGWLGELTALPQASCLDFRGPTSKEGDEGGRGRVRREEKGRKRRGKREDSQLPRIG